MPEDHYSPRDTNEIEKKIEDYLKSLEEPNGVKDGQDMQKPSEVDPVTAQTENTEKKRDSYPWESRKSFRKSQVLSYGSGLKKAAVWRTSVPI